MGTPIPVPEEDTPVPAGDLCSNCWGPAGILGDGPTPESVIAKVFGIRKGPNWNVFDGEPLEGEFILNQQPAAACIFRGAAAGSLLTLVFTANDSGMLVTASSGNFMFESDIGSACVLSFVSELDDHFVGGSVSISIPPVT